MIIYRCILPNGKMYIGQTSRKLKERINEHIKTSKMQLDNRYNYPFYRAIRKYGENNLIWEIIDRADTQIELDEKEKYWIDYCTKSLARRLALSNDFLPFLKIKVAVFVYLFYC